MTLKTSRKLAIEKVSPIPSSKNFILEGVSCLCINPTFKVALGNALCDDNTFFDIFGDNDFFYMVEQFSPSHSLMRYEKGVGYVTIEGDNFILNRKIPFCTGKNYSEKNPCHNGPVDFTLYEGEYLIAYSTMPESSMELLSEPHSMVTCSAPYLPQVITVKENSFVGREDSDISSVSVSSTFFQNSVTNALSKFTKQIFLKCSKLSTKYLSTDILQLNPISNPSGKVGNVVYDENKKALKYYDGNQWRILLSEIE